MAQELHQNSPEKTARDLDPNVRQRQAADPEGSVWVSASAGTGKTKVLTDRVLRLLLPRTDGAPGTKPHKVLCLTFTKAAASEMALRIHEKLSEWAVINSEELEKELQKLLGRTPSNEDLETARELFADVVDTPGGLKIMTIHSFCQSVLGRFPLEADLPPYFTVMEEGHAELLLRSARDYVLSTAEKDAGSDLHHALKATAKTINDDQFLKLVRNMISERHQFTHILEKNFGIDGLYTALCSALDIPVGINSQSLLLEASQDHKIDLPALREACNMLIEKGSKTHQANGDILSLWLSQTPEMRAQNFKAYRGVFFTQSHKPKAKLGSKSVPETAIETLQKEQQRLATLQNQMNAANCAAMTRDLLRLGEQIINQYQSLKNKQAVLDYDDLIFETERLLTKKGTAAWVLYKLDQGLDHILIDEAQDTNPEQWKIAQALCDEFFSGEGQKEIPRSIFTVGDEKQSIYSFQRASPEEFSRMRSFFAEKITQNGSNWNDLDLNISFRSTQAVLNVVDAVFSNPALQKGLSDKPIQHHAFRRHQAGHVELWPLFESEISEETDPWEPPVKIVETRSGATLLAEHISQKIHSWIDDKVILESKNRPIHAGDILILVRTRTAFVGQLTRALKNHNIPVSGVDRMTLRDQLPVQDLMTFAEFSLLPNDDLTLATLLKTPIIGMSEEDLYNLAIDRIGTLWESLQNSNHKDITTYLSDLINFAGDAHPYEFFSQLLQRPCPADNISGVRAIRGRLGDDALDPIDEFLNAALDFEQSNIPSLQKFLRWHNEGESQIKRELSEHSKQVRIMTVHGAKGLQAPIVIMPDCTRSMMASPAQTDRRLIWPDKSGLAAPLWSARKDYDFQTFNDALSTLDQRSEEEYRRLLYVAMTRAEDRLYVAGYQNLKKPLEESWYNYIKAGILTLPDHEALDDGSLRYTNPQTGPHEKGKHIEIQSNEHNKLPEWVYNNAPKEPHPPAPLVPSRPSENEKAAISPLHSNKMQRFMRGNLTHKLLEILPELSKDKREAAGAHFLKRYGGSIDTKTQKDIINETLTIFDHPEFSQIFGPNSQAEVPITGLTDSSRVISGQIDRLLVTDTDIWIIDYKTNRKPPDGPEDVQEVYIKQLRAYADTLKKIYPGRAVHTALLWTDGPVLMPIDT